MSVSTWYDARYVLQEAKKAFPKNGKFRILLIELKQKIRLLKETLKVCGRHEEDVKRIVSLMYDSSCSLPPYTGKK